MGDSSRSSPSIALQLNFRMNHSITTMSGKTKIKIVLLGDASVGKTCIIDQFINHRFEETANPTVGIDFLAKNVVQEGKSYRLQLWDTAGQQRFRSLIPNYLKDSYCALLVFDVTNKATFHNIPLWKQLFEENVGEGKHMCLVANKIDRQFREVTQEQAKSKAAELKIPYYEISAKTGQNIEQMFHSVIDHHSGQAIAANCLLSDKKALATEGIEPVKQMAEQEEKQKEKDKSTTDKTQSKLAAPQPSAEAEKKEDNIVLKNESKPADKKKEKCC